MQGALQVEARVPQASRSQLFLLKSAVPALIVHLFPGGHWTMTAVSSLSPSFADTWSGPSYLKGAREEIPPSQPQGR